MNASRADQGPTRPTHAGVGEAERRAALELVDLAIAEDIGDGDVTSDAVIGPEQVLAGRIVAKQRGVVAGLFAAALVFERIDPAVDFEALVEDGSAVEPGELLAVVTGPGRSVLRGERVALNFLQRMSGIATTTRAFVDAVAVTRAVILDTRKTLPGFRLLDKYAVRAGGGVNHRLGLYDMVLVKDNHVDAAGSLDDALRAAVKASGALPVEVEVRNLDELDAALSLDLPLTRVLLDNMDIATLERAVAHTAGRVALEASGGVTLDNVGDIAATGVDAISVGALTHSVTALDISLKTAPAIVTPDSLATRARQLKLALGDGVTILGHHYQRDEVIALCDRRGDSLGLAREAVAAGAPCIVFCGVHFMAETAAILAESGQRVVVPDLSAGCFLADTANLAAVEAAWERLDALLKGRAAAEIVPVTYVNSSAALKAFCGRLGGIVCTSGNATAVLRKAFEERPRVLFFPDQHLGRNVGRALGIDDGDMALLGPHARETALRDARLYLWPGACNVHRRFTTNDVARARRDHPDARVIVHPECAAEVVALADDAGSTAHMIDAISRGAPDQAWVVGTETRLVKRIAAGHPGAPVVSLSAFPAHCTTMSQVTLEKLVATLEGISSGRVENEVAVPREVAAPARLALERMLEVS